MKNDPCYKEGESTFRKIKFTTCVQNQFTCNDGECIDIEKRYIIIYSFLKVKNVEIIEIAFKIVLNLKKHTRILKITPFDDLFQWKFLENSVEQFLRKIVFLNNNYRTILMKIFIERQPMHPR